jgi:hypothetical protein
MTPSQFKRRELQTHRRKVAHLEDALLRFPGKAEEIRQRIDAIKLQIAELEPLVPNPDQCTLNTIPECNPRDEP